MYEESGKRPKFPITLMRVTILLATITAAVVSIVSSENVFAYESNQAKSDVNECGNGLTPTDIGCQNLDSQSQGDENTVVLTAHQSFPAPPPPPPETCEECFTDFLNQQEIDDFIDEASLDFSPPVTSLEELCLNLTQTLPSLSPSGAEAYLNFFVTLNLEAAGIDDATIGEILVCLREFFGLPPLP